MSGTHNHGMNMQFLDGYCERAGDPHFWAEPVNAVTNAAFLVAGIAVLALGWRSGEARGTVLWLGALICVIGIGSFLFHTYATRWAAIADVAPIGLFIVSYFTIAMHEFFRLSWVRAGLWTIGFIVALGLTSWLLRGPLLPIIGGSVSYVPAYLGLTAVGAALWVHGHRAAPWLLFAANTFAISLTLRAVDLPICDAFTVGTHLFWHILNAVVLGTLGLAVLYQGRRRAI